MKAYWKDILRTIIKGRKRIFSIMIITILGVTMFTGIAAGCRDLRYAGDQLFDQQDLYDIRIVSTLGLTDDDIEALKKIDGVEWAEGTYSETVLTQAAGKQQEAEVKVLRENGLSQPSLIEGTLPSKADEIAVTENYCRDTGKNIGDTLILEQEDTGEDSVDDTESESSDETDDDFEVELEKEEEPAGLINLTYTITAIVLDPTDLIADEGAASFRSSESVEYYFFVTEDAVDSDIYTAAELTVSGAKELMCYSDEYSRKIDEVTDAIETQIKEQREQARYDEVIGEAQEQLDDARKTVDDKFREAEEEIADARQELEDGWIEIKSGWEKINDGQRELDKQEQTANQKFLEAYLQIQDGYEQLQTAEQRINESEQQIISGKEQLAAGKSELEAQKEAALSQISSGKEQLVAGKEQAAAGKQQIDEQVSVLQQTFGDAWPQDAWETCVSSLEQAQTEEERTAAKNALSETLIPIVNGTISQIDFAMSLLDPSMEGYEEQLAALTAQKEQLSALPDQVLLLAEEAGKVNATISMLDTQLAALEQQQALAEEQFAAAEQELFENEQALQKGEEELNNGKIQLQNSKSELDNGLEELKKQEADARQQIADAKAELEDGKQELIDGEKELKDGEQELLENEQKLEEAKEKANEKLSDAQAEIDDIDMTKWYVQDRSSIGSFSTIESDAASIDTIGTVFPILFLAVAILISLTTITRMVEEERGLIGIYKALGYRDIAVYGKYLIYTILACLLGGIIGDFCGFVLLPKFLFTVFGIMYKLPSYPLLFHTGDGIIGILLFMIGVVGAAFIVCHSELKQTPAALMRPKAPKAGSRVFLEYIPLIWKRMSFLNKVTVRNLFRYKKRLFMTVCGIMGCTALVLVGMAIKNSVTELMPNQYNHIYRYDLITVAMPEDNDALLEHLSEDDEVEDYINLQIDSVNVKMEDSGEEESVQLYIVPEGESLSGYILLESLSGEELSLTDDGIIVTQNLSDVMYFDEGDTLQIQNSDLVQKEAQVTAVVHNYLGNAVYMTQSYYEKLFGDYEPNGVLIRLKDSCEDHAAYAEQLSIETDVISCSSTQEMREDFSSAFSLVNSVVVLVTVLAAGLAFVVLFTLATTNISERERELATIKVLGFFDREVHLYVNKETLVLTLIGIILGLPVGRFFSGLLTSVLKMPAVYFAVYVYPSSYVFAAVMTFVFALIVNLITNRSLDRIDMVDALKSVE